MLIEKRREKGQIFTLCLTEPSEDLWVTSEVSTWATFDVWAVRDSIVAHLSKTTSKMPRLVCLHPFGDLPRRQQNSESWWNHVSNPIKELQPSHTGTAELLTGGKTYRRRSPAAEEVSVVMHRALFSFQFMSILEWNETHLPHKNNQNHTGDVKLYLSFLYLYLTCSSWFLMLMPLIFTV